MAGRGLQVFFPLAHVGVVGKLLLSVCRRLLPWISGLWLGRVALLWVALLRVALLWVALLWVALLLRIALLGRVPTSLRRLRVRLKRLGLGVGGGYRYSSVTGYDFPTPCPALLVNEAHRAHAAQHHAHHDDEQNTQAHVDQHALDYFGILLYVLLIDVEALPYGAAAGAEALPAAEDRVRGIAQPRASEVCLEAQHFLLTPHGVTCVKSCEA